LTVLNKDLLISWQKEFPKLEKKLQSFCSKFDNVHELLKIHGMERRGKGRHEVKGKVSVRLLNAHGKMEERIFRGDIHDVSADGLALIIKLPDELTSKLLGRNLNMKFLLYVDADQQEIDQNGKVVAVSCKVTEQHSVHIRFEKTILPLMKAKSVEGLLSGDLSGEGLSGEGLSGRQGKNAKKSEQEKDDFLKTTW
ncbi:PilZ domain-containing protein, partial [Desulfobacterales bacterium HSG16]|nr:PilZ domain-containing protein [Desulfobacterales bacterium HSG16]